jgi:hypothetical protein
MTARIRASLLATLLLLPVVIAQGGPPDPAPQLQKLEPMIGNWSGRGTAQMGPGAPTPWTARGSYRRVLGGHFVREDFEIVFEGRPVPMVFRTYLGWDHERGRYVNATVTNAGAARLHGVDLLENGTLLQLMRQEQQGLPYAERARSRVSGDTMQLTIDLLMPDGPSATIVDGTLQRGGPAFEVDWNCKGFAGASPAAPLQRLLRSAGDYDVEGAMVHEPGAAAVAIHGTDSFRGVFGGTIFHGETKGAAAGMPGEYVGDVFWCFDAERDCLHGIYVSNFGGVRTDG